jgi:hypothetical protein
MVLTKVGVRGDSEAAKWGCLAVEGRAEYSVDLSADLTAVEMVLCWVD